MSSLFSDRKKFYRAEAVLSFPTESNLDGISNRNVRKIFFKKEFKLTGKPVIISHTTIVIGKNLNVNQKLES